MGVLSNASICFISIMFSFTAIISQRLVAMRLGRKGECVANTPVRGLFLSARGWTCMTARFSGVSFLSNQYSTCTCLCFSRPSRAG